MSTREVLRTQRRPSMGSDIAMTIALSDYRTVNGIQVPFLMVIAPDGMPEPIRLHMVSVEFGLALTRRDFVRP